MTSRAERYQGCLLGLACGDALGTTLEFRPPGSFAPITDMLGGGPFRLQPGQWTDDTAMALCLARSLIEKKAFDAHDQMQRYCQWRSQGYMSSNGRCFDIGVTVSEALSHFMATGEAFAGSTNPFSAGNGSLMRLAPVVMFFSPNLQQAIHYAGESSRTTHAAAECIDACRYFASLLHSAFEGAEKNSLLANRAYTPECKKVAAIQRGSFVHKTTQQLKGSGYVIDCLEAALGCFYRSESYKEAVLSAANLGDDADTTAAVCGQIAGAWYGVEAIPGEWLNKLSLANEIRAMADALNI